MQKSVSQKTLFNPKQDWNTALHDITYKSVKGHIRDTLSDENISKNI